MTRITNGTAAVRENQTEQSALLQRMDDLHMSEGDRRAAAEWLHDGESMADFICRATDALRATAAFLEHRYLMGDR